MDDSTRLTDVNYKETAIAEGEISYKNTNTF
jgi:hypothetical protein